MRRHPAKSNHQREDAVRGTHTLEALPPHPLGNDQPRVIYGEACRLGDATLARVNVTFRQTPYALREG